MAKTKVGFIAGGTLDVDGALVEVKAKLGGRRRWASFTRSGRTVEIAVATVAYLEGPRERSSPAAKVTRTQRNLGPKPETAGVRTQRF